MTHRLSLAILTLAFVGTSACAAPPAAETVEGIHIRLKGISPFFADTAARQLKEAKEQCESPQIKELCAAPHVAADKSSAALCAAVAGGFKFKGILADVGKTETDEYYWPARRMRASYGKGYVLKVKALCELEVVEDKTARIMHHAPGGGGIRYELQDRPKKGRYWSRSDIPKLTPEMFAALEGKVPFTDRTKVSPVLGTDMIAGHKCEIREVAGPWTWTLCQKATGTSFPESVALSVKAVAGKTVMTDAQATEVAMKVVLPGSLFFPPAGDKIESAGSKSAASPTEKWCEKQKIKTGVNPCKDDPDDGE